MSARTVSINMDGTLGDYGHEPEQPGLDMNDMVADFDGTGVLNFAQPEESKDGTGGESALLLVVLSPERRRLCRTLLTPLQNPNSNGRVESLPRRPPTWP